MQNLPTPTKKPGFFPNLRITTNIVIKTRFLATHAKLTHSDKETGFFPKSANHKEVNGGLNRVYTNDVRLRGLKKIK
jgi:hypothetical protein